MKEQSARPRLQRYAKERLRKARSSYAALVILLVLFLSMGGTIGYLVAARQDAQTDLDSLIEIIASERDQLDGLSDRLTELEDRSGGSIEDQSSSSQWTSVAPGGIDTTSGIGSATTDVVSARGPWRLEWAGDDVFVFVKRAKDGALVDADGGQGSGSLVIHEDGRFVMDVLARGSWSIAVDRS